MNIDWDDIERAYRPDNYNRGFKDGQDEALRINFNSRLDLTERVFSVIIEEEINKGTSVERLIKAFHRALEEARKKIAAQRAQEEAGH